MVEWRLGSGRVPEGGLCSTADCARRIAHSECPLDAGADDCHGALAILALAGGRGVALWTDGVGARRQRRRHEYQPDGAGAATIHGTGAEYFLLFWDLAADRARPDSGRGCLARKSGR